MATKKKDKKRLEIRITNPPPKLYEWIKNQSEKEKRTMPAQAELMLEFAKSEGI